MSRRFVRDTAIGSMLGVPAVKNPPVSRWKKLWEFTGGAFIEGLTESDTADETNKIPDTELVSSLWQTS
jgi:hypothetical protein